MYLRLYFEVKKKKTPAISVSILHKDRITQPKKQLFRMKTIKPPTGHCINNLNVDPTWILYTMGLDVLA